MQRAGSAALIPLECAWLARDLGATSSEALAEALAALCGLHF
jgi:hypothetical protein